MACHFGIQEVFSGHNPVVENREILARSSRNAAQEHEQRADPLYGYDASIASLFGRTSSDRILQHVHTLIAELVANRLLEGAMEQPIIFICHSLGGILVKRTLAYSASRTSKYIQHVHSIFLSTYAVLFRGTPHMGSDNAKLASTGRRMIDTMVPSKVVDTDGQLLEALKEGSETLQNVTDMFAPLMNSFRIYFFWGG